MKQMVKTPIEQSSHIGGQISPANPIHADPFNLLAVFEIRGAGMQAEDYKNMGMPTCLRQQSVKQLLLKSLGSAALFSWSLDANSHRLLRSPFRCFRFFPPATSRTKYLCPRRDTRSILHWQSAETRRDPASVPVPEET